MFEMIWLGWMRPARWPPPKPTNTPWLPPKCRLQIAAHWTDLHPGDAVQVSRIPGSERPIRVGGDGTPTIGDFAPAELGCVLGISDGAASRLIGDALDLRHRLKLVWAAMMTGQVPAYQARHIATATRHLTLEQAGAS